MNAVDSRRAASVIQDSPMLNPGPLTDEDLVSEETFNAKRAKDASVEAMQSKLSKALKETTSIDVLPPDMLKLFLQAEAAMVQSAQQPAER